MNRGARACGTVSGYAGGCRCPICRGAWNDWQRRRRRLVAYGRWQPFTDAGPVRDHLAALRAAGLSLSQIAAMAGVSPGALRSLAYPDRARGRPPSRRVRHATATAVLAVQPGCLPPGGVVPGAGTVRRLRALSAAGWPLRELGENAGVNWQALARTARRGQAHVAAPTAAAVAGLYGRLWDRPGPSTVSARRAAARGYLPALAWDDGYGPHGIDNPAATAYPCARPARSPYRAADLAEDAAELAAQGYGRAEAAARLGVTRAALDKAIERTRRRAA